VGVIVGGFGRSLTPSIANPITAIAEFDKSGHPTVWVAVTIGRVFAVLVFTLPMVVALAHCLGRDEPHVRPGDPSQIASASVASFLCLFT
jgi:hypothetical protein